MSDVEICIGLNDDWSRPSGQLIDIVLTHFRDAGYRTEINTPFSNSVTPEKDFHYKSFMIEVNKSVYLHDDNSPAHPGMQSLKESISALYSKLLHLPMIIPRSRFSAV